MPKVPYADCENCPLRRQPIANTRGPADSETILVSRSPGYHEAMAGRPFSGPAGKVLDYFLKQNGVDRKDIRVTNVVLCAPPAGKVPKEAIQACSGRLYKELESAKLVIAAGTEAVSSILGKRSVESCRGYSHERIVNRNGSIDTQRVVTTNNPALVLHDDSTFPNLQKDFKLVFNPKPQPTFPEVEVIEDEHQARKVLHSLASRGTTIAADIESRGGLTLRAKLVSVQFAVEGSHAYVLGERGGIFRDKTFVRDYLRPFFENPRVSFVWHNGVFDTRVLRATYGINARIDEDTLLLSYALDERPGVHALEYILMDEYGWPNYEPESVKRFKKTGVVEDYDELYTYAGWDAAGTFQLLDTLGERAKHQGVWDRPYRNLYVPKANMLVQVMLNGIRYNVHKAADIYENDMSPELDKLIFEMRTLAGLPLLNPRSTKQMPALIYDDWGIEHSQQSRPDKARSVDKMARKEVIENRYTTKASRQKKDDTQFRKITILPFFKDFDRYKTLEKQASTYILSLIERAELEPDGRIFTDFLLHGTESGRISGRNPNLQNITRDKENLPSIRGLFESSPGRLIVSADFSQAELRCIAYKSGDSALKGIYYDSTRSLHHEQALKFYGKGYTHEQYTFAKNMNFGIFYGQSAFSFSQMYEIPLKDAQGYVDSVWASFPGVKAWTEEIKKEIRTRGYTQSEFGRRRRFYLITDENKDHAEKEAVNFQGQSDASDFTLCSADTLLKEVDTTRAALCILVHDAIVSDVEEDYVEEFSTITKQVMSSAPKDELSWDIPFVVDVGYGPSWGEAK